METRIENGIEVEIEIGKYEEEEIEHPLVDQGVVRSSSSRERRKNTIQQ